jgi:LEA14-like dessication related protein
MNATRLSLSLSILLAGALTVAACSAPSVNLKKADLKQVTTAALNLGLAFDVTNPNQYTLPLKRLDWNLDLFKSPFTNGAVNLGKQIGAGRTSSLDVPLAVRFPRSASAVQSILAGRAIPWGLGGKCNFETPIGPINVNFAKDGTWQNPIRDIKKILGQSVPVEHHVITPSEPIRISVTLAGLEE